jgi:polysaccharide biosynthesis protein PslH
MRRESVLYVTPVMPQRSGNGLAMRAGQVLEGLAHRFDVHLFVVPVAGELGPPPPFVRQHIVRIGSLDLATSLDPHYALIARVIDPEERWRAELAYPKPRLSRFCTGEAAERLLDWSGQARVTAVHVMRLCLAPLAQPFLKGSAPDRPLCVLDLDDDEVRTRQRLAQLHAEGGDSRSAAAEAAEAEKYQAFAERYLPAFDRVIVCSEADAGRLGRQFPSVSFAVVPNGSGLSGPLPPRRPSDEGPLRLLFVGTLGYFPNADAALFLCREVLPALRRLTERQIRIDLAGAGDTSAIRGLDLDPAIRLHGFVDDLAPLYATADVAVVPVRASGGTRIKILEAFAYGVPVVSTTVGAEGIGAVDGEQLLLADDAEAFARACLELKERQRVAATLVARARALLEERYGPAQIEAALAGVYGHRS